MAQRDHRGRSPQAVGHDRGRRRARDSCWRSGRFSTDQAGYAAMRELRRGVAGAGLGGRGQPTAPAGRWRSGCWRPASTWSTCPAKLAARVRLFDTGHNRKTDAHDAHSIAVVAVRTKGLRVLSLDGELEALRMLVDRREELTRRRVQTVNRLQRLLAELLPGTGQEGPHRRAGQGDARPRAARATSPARPAAGIAAEELAELVAVEQEDQEGHRPGAQGDGPRPRLDADGPARRRARRRRPDPGRRRRRRPVRRPQPVRVLDRHRTARTPPPASRSATGSPGPGTGG